MAATDGMSVPQADKQMLLDRHRKEMKDLRAKIQALKRSVPKGDKRRKKEVDMEIAQLDDELQKRQKQEIADLESQQQADVSTKPKAEERLQDLELGERGGDGLRGGVEEGEGRRPVKKSRAQKRKEKKAQKEREQEQRITEEEAEAIKDNPRVREQEQLTSILQPLGLEIKDIHPDGHCLYAAVSDQLSVRLGLKCSVSQLRVECADYIHSHSPDFLPYLTDTHTGKMLTEEQFAQYCTEIRSTAAWGGHAEILALSHVYKIPIRVYQTNSPPLCIGEEYHNEGGTLTLSYHLHEYSLGEHYNSVVPTAVSS